MILDSADARQKSEYLIAFFTGGERAVAHGGEHHMIQHRDAPSSIKRKAFGIFAKVMHHIKPIPPASDAAPIMRAAAQVAEDMFTFRIRKERCFLLYLLHVMPQKDAESFIA